MLLVTADQMREMDRRAIEDIGIPGIVLMERAALGGVDTLVAHFAPRPGTRIGILCGGGNNGGDGLAMARMLTELQFDAWVGALRAPSEFTGDALTNANIIEEMGLPLHDLSSASADDLRELLENVEPCTIWVDAVFGTGLDREVEGTYATAIEFLNSQPRVLAVDIPSGIHADTGQVLGIAVHAEATASFGQLKLGQVLYPGRDRCGDLYPVEIGIPASVTQSVGWTAELLTEDRWLPERPSTFHKGEAGRVAIVGGEPGKNGSVLMSATAALRSGAGLVTVGTYDECVPGVATVTPEAMATGVLARSLEQTHVDRLDELIDFADVVAIGPGLGTHEAAFEVVEQVLDADVAVVLDADALTLLAEQRMRLGAINAAPVILTPHPGEAARLCGCSIAEVVADPVGKALELAEEWNAIVVLKGAASVVVQHEPRRIAINSSGNPGMASAGMGDALTGIIAAQLRERVPAFEAVCTAVWVHGAAGDLAATTQGYRGLTVSSLLDALGQVWSSLEVG